jgi:hypothetical protein
MKQGRKNPTVRLVYAVTSIAMIVAGLMAVSACTSNGGSKALGERMGKEDSARSAGNSTAPAKADPGINLNCIYDHLQNPRESFHYIYKKDTSDNEHVDQEADITPQTIDGLRRQPDGSQKPVHGVRSDPEGWQSALANLTAISGISSTVAIVNHSSAMKSEPDGGQVNGYDTIHYSIDTARFDATERNMLLKPGEFERGDAWVTSEGCPVKLALDSELHRNDGSLIETLHYEEAMVKK